jgi:hypothetical protein
MTKDEALRLALQALEYEAQKGNDNAYQFERKAIKTALEAPEEKYIYGTPLLDVIKEALAHPEQHQDWCASLTQMLMSMPPKPAPCNCKPLQQEAKDEPVQWKMGASVICSTGVIVQPQRTWVGLTDEERYELLSKADWAHDPESYAVLVEAKLKDKNHDY